MLFLILPFVYLMRQIGGEVGFVMFLLTAFFIALNITAMNCFNWFKFEFC